jgi:hypothetical protein
MTNGELQEIKARVDAATPGPWAVEVESIRPRVEGERITDAHGHTVCRFEVNDPPDANATFVFMARVDVPALLDEVKRLREALSQVLGQQHVLRYTAKLLVQWKDDPVWLKAENRIGEVERFVRTAEEWHQILVAAVES